MRESLAYYESSCDASVLPKMSRAPLPDIPNLSASTLMDHKWAAKVSLVNLSCVILLIL